MKSTILAAIAVFTLATGAASAQTAPSVATPESASTVPVLGNNSGIDSTMPVDAASTVVVGSDAAPVPTTPASPVPGNSAGETAAPAN